MALMKGHACVEKDPGCTAGAVVSTRRGRGDAKEPNQASSFARAFNKVVGSSERGPTGPTDVLSVRPRAFIVV